jgi:medium-chain acyl-[acyl-carrier-protein] hydrolase
MGKRVTTQWTVTPRPNPRAALRLICVPHAGGGVDTFRGWSERLPTAEVSVVQLPGRGTRLREPLVESAVVAADRIVESLASVPAYPTVLFGHGAGALIAFEVARRLEHLHWPVLALFVSGRRGPAIPDSAPRLSDLPLEDFVAEMLGRDELIPAAALADREQLQLLLPALRADLAMMDNYRYQSGAPLRCPIVACGGSGDADASRSGMEAWKMETRGRFSLHTFSGGHAYLQREQEALTALVANQLSVMLGAMARWAAAR